MVVIVTGNESEGNRYLYTKECTLHWWGDASPRSVLGSSCHACSWWSCRWEGAVWACSSLWGENRLHTGWTGAELKKIETLVRVIGRNHDVLQLEKYAANWIRVFRNNAVEISTYEHSRSCPGRWRGALRYSSRTAKTKSPQNRFRNTRLITLN